MLSDTDRLRLGLPLRTKPMSLEEQEALELVGAVADQLYSAAWREDGEAEMNKRWERLGEELKAWRAAK